MCLAALPALSGQTSASRLDDPAALCQLAAEQAARRSGVPVEVLLAISLVETGRNGTPWAWTVNLGGDGHWLDSQAEAQTLVEAALAAGATNIDLGCFQLNYRWHAAAFASLADMLDPARNAAYAADYLVDRFAETGTWADAAAAYHSATPEHADRYRARFEAVLAGLGPVPDSPAPSRQVPVANGFPLLVRGEPGRNGSLVPPTDGGARLIGGP